MNIKHEILADFVKQIFEAVGTPPAAAELVANSLVLSNLLGHDSHGVVRVMQYLDGIKAGEYKPAAEPTISREKGGVALVDAGFGFGQVAAHFAMTTAIAKARQYGLASVGLEHCNHVGRLGEWMEMAAAEHMIGLAFCNGAGPGGRRLVAPFGGGSPILGTNPFAAAIPVAGGSPVVLDFATSVVAEGKVRVARNSGNALPEGCILNAAGEPSINPQDLYEGGALLPMAGHKGYGLSILMEFIGGILTGRAAPGSGDVIPGNGVLFVVLEVAAFRPFELFLDEAADFATHVQSTPPAAGFERVLLPGQPEQQTAERRRTEGIPIDETTWGLLADTAAGLGISVPGI